eukprot:CAMPEP_0116575568 /NCGR_PEP_ID=MMETSP0397-20121206/20029_1 /TAXON_ID=216820 /ORGANISM="Cyclophora tenuis, Strain ECT3854" /LENGTH=212 /DNA_ID=CAMNT_0004104473 /DNA_START=95 /DNA_END=731 /DNA_ORIENTATION=+
MNSEFAVCLASSLAKSTVPSATKERTIASLSYAFDCITVWIWSTIREDTLAATGVTWRNELTFSNVVAIDSRMCLFLDAKCFCVRFRTSSSTSEAASVDPWPPLKQLQKRRNVSIGTAENAARQFPQPCHYVRAQDSVAFANTDDVGLRWDEELKALLSPELGILGQKATLKALSPPAAGQLSLSWTNDNGKWPQAFVSRNQKSHRQVLIYW